LIIGLAPAAHGGNRTGRVFTGDDSGHFLFRALHKAGFANQPLSIHRDDGLTLQGTYITAILHCAPPDNKPKPVEIKRCRPYLMEEIRLLKQVKVVLALGRIAFEGYLTTLKEMELLPTKPTLDFAHGRSYDLGPSLPSLFASYHPSRQNTQTGRLTEAMFDNLFRKINTVLREIHSIPITGTGRRA
jgi:uracil-DNA glycosylase family 4